MQIFQTPVIGLTCFAVILASWFGGIRYPMGVPAGLVALIIGTIIAWGSNVVGLNYGGLTHSAVVRSFTELRLLLSDTGSWACVLRL